ncbi:cystatin [Amia ocellicauda]|uniref:cystatin n=1 Tax=Amia ocellicauda TaxID=2972642 RepID=UPI003464AAD1|nr:CYT protein [Amia calva]
MKMSVSWKATVLLLAMLFAVVAVGAADPMGGAPMEADVNEPEVQDALRVAVSEYNKASNDMFASKVANVVDVKKQVVAGMKYILTVEMGRTSCKNGEAEVWKLCVMHEEAELATTRTCTFEVWSRPWLSDTRLLKTTCE